MEEKAKRVEQDDEDDDEGGVLEVAPILIRVRNLPRQCVGEPAEAAKNESGQVRDGVHGREPDEHDHGEFDKPFTIFLALRRLRIEKERHAEDDEECHAAHEVVARTEALSKLPLATAAHVGVVVDVLGQTILLHLLQARRRSLWHFSYD